MSFQELDSKLRNMVAKLDVSGKVARMQIDLLPIIASLLEQWLTYMPDHVLRSQIGVLGDVNSVTIYVADLPELVKSGDLTVLKLLKAIFPPEGQEV